jgi:hypothetical protein
MNEKKKPEPEKASEEQKHPHAWTGSWDRPMKINEECLDPLTAARMTDHNVRGVSNDDQVDPRPPIEPSEKKPEGKKPDDKKAA